MYTYTFKFEIFGQKKSWSTTAPDEATAKRQLNDLILSKMKIVEVEGKRAEKPKPKYTSLDQLMDEIFDKFGK